MEVKLFSKIYGCLLGSAIGNAFGSPFENMDYKDIEKQYGKVTDFLKPEMLETEDDNAVALLLCRTYIKKQGRVTSDDLAKVWLDEMEPKKYFWCMRNAYELLKKGFPPRLTGIFNIVTGSAIMAIAPVGLYNACDPEQAFIDAIDIGYMYQPQLDTECAAIFASCIAESMKPDATVKSIIEIALKKSPKNPYISFDKRNPDNIHDSLKKTLKIASKYKDIFSAREELRKVFQWHPIDPLEVLCLTLAIFKITNGNYKECLISAANLGRDSDTIGNLTGALCGALYGAKVIPEEWIKKISKKSIDVFYKVSYDFTSLLKKKYKEIEKQIFNIRKIIYEGQTP
ncbi:MAG: ADP-ribosylglycohydrolase family protein [Candidatus Omnitrophica bacterium]|nr:ADP-ribosylglycohydrolase family protein [Candidatus Omnitrophota bacterium]